MLISDWSSDVCSSDLDACPRALNLAPVSEGGAGRSQARVIPVRAVAFGTRPAARAEGRGRLVGSSAAALIPFGDDGGDLEVAAASLRGRSVRSKPKSAPRQEVKLP